MYTAGDSKTEKATPKKREDERKKGNLFQSKDIISAFSVLIIFYVLKISFPYIHSMLSNMMQEYILKIKTVKSLNIYIAMDVYKNSGAVLFLTAGPVLLASMLVGIIASGVQTRFKFTGELLKFKFSRINPLEGFRRLFSMNSVFELIKSIAKITVIAYILFLQLKDMSGSFLKLISVDVAQAVYFILNSIMDIVIRLSMVFMAIAALDFFYQWWHYEKNIRMSKQELKEEYKMLEGSPEIKGKIKERQRKMSSRRMMQKVPKADVVIRNPEHIAIALKYDYEKDAAPVVVAKGLDDIALKIVEIAEYYNIPTQENKPLARAMYDAVQVDRPIPPLFYAAVAEIMAWVYTMKRETEGNA
ncbi:MAG: flagellar biosynthesis protein FlhB [Bacillota bacterium]|nr:flagellar biosynthesis protein FlhB [Bacillota bacterium]